MRIEFPEILPIMAPEITVLDMHTAGEPVRIFDARAFNLGDGNVLSKRRRFADNHDALRRTIMHEPRGHSEMYGAILVKPALPDSDAAVLFCHNGGYSTMCGHASIALGRLLHDSSKKAGFERTEFKLECPCGPVDVSVSCQGRYGFDAVPSFCEGMDLQCDLPGFGPIRFDVGYGGAFYAVVDDREAGLSLEHSPVREIWEFARALTSQLRATREFVHPAEQDLGFLYGTIVTDGVHPQPGGTTRNLCWFGDGQIDRSPTGSGVSARLAIAVSRGLISAGDTCSFIGPAGHGFQGSVKCVTENGVMTHVEGMAYYTGLNRLLVEPTDPLAKGFVLSDRLPPAVVDL